MFDNGKIRVSELDGIPLIEVYHNGELELRDIAWINHVILHELTPTPKLHADIIIDKKGSYSLSVEAVTQGKAYERCQPRGICRLLVNSGENGTVRK